MSGPSNVAKNADNSWSRLSEGLIQKIASYLHPHDVAIYLKLLDRETARCLKEYRRIQLSQPLTPAPSWAENDEAVHVAYQPLPSAAFLAHWGRPEPWRALSLRQRRRLLCLAANSGCAASLEAALAQCGCSLTSEVAVAAVLGGSVAACETLLIREGCDGTARLEDVAAEAGHLELLRWLRQARRQQLLQTPPQQRMPNGAPEEITTAVAACYGGHVHVLAWLQEEEQQQRQQEGQDEQQQQQQQQEGQDEQQQQQQQQQQEGHDEQQQQQQQPEGQEVQQQQPGFGALFGADAAGPLTIAHPKAVPFLAGAAAAGGHVGLLNQLLPRLEPIPTGAACSMLEKVARGCPLEALQRVYLHLYDGGDVDPGASARQTLAVHAAVSPTPDWEAKLDWVLQQQQPNGPLPAHLDPEHSVFKDGEVIMSGAGRLPDWLQRLQALCARNVPLPTLFIFVKRAAAVGDVAALSWLLGEGAGLTNGLVAEAASGGHVPILSALRDRGCQFSNDHVLRAARAGKPAAVSWLLGQPLQSPVTDWQTVTRRVARSGAGLAELRQLHERHGAPICLDGIAEHGSVEALEWAVAALQQQDASRRRGAQVGNAILRGIQRDTVWHAAQYGNLAAADWLSQLLAVSGLGGPRLPMAGSARVLSAPDVQSLFGAWRWWLRQRQEGRGALQAVRDQEGGYGGEQEEQVGALTNGDWQSLLTSVASSALSPPAYPGEWKYSRAQWNWLVAQRLEAAAAAQAAGEAEGAVAAAHADVEQLVRYAATWSQVALQPPEPFGGLEQLLALMGQIQENADHLAAAQQEWAAEAQQQQQQQQ